RFLRLLILIGFGWLPRFYDPLPERVDIADGYRLVFQIALAAGDLVDDVADLGLDLLGLGLRLAHVLASNANGYLSNIGGYTRIVSTKISKTDAEWRAELTPGQYDILRAKGTE